MIARNKLKMMKTLFALTLIFFAQRKPNLKQICPSFGVFMGGLFVVVGPVTVVPHSRPAESLSVVLCQTSLGLGVGQLDDP